MNSAGDASSGAASHMYGYEIVARSIQRFGFKSVFGVMGNGNLSWLSYGYSKGLFDYIPFRREDGAVAAAAGFARASGKVGLATVTHGPGLGNTFTALAAAVKDNSPIVLLIGVPALSNPTALQRMDHPSLAKLAGAAYHQVEIPQKISTTIERAKLAASRDKRPQVVGIYHDHFETKVDELAQVFATEQQGSTLVEPPSSEIGRAIDIISKASKPLILAGQGSTFSGARDAIESLGEKIGALFADTMLARHEFGSNDNVVGMVGISGHPVTDQLIEATDVVLVVGASLNFSQTRRFKMFEGKKIILIEQDPSRVPDFQSLDLVLLGDAAATVRALDLEWSRRGFSDRQGARTPHILERIANFKVYNKSEDTTGKNGVDPRAVYAMLDEQLPEDRIIVTDGGRVIETLHHIMNAQDARSYLYCSGFASIGLGLGCSIGAGHATGDRPLLHISGDGGFLMSAQELDTVVRSGMQMLVFVMNDSQYGSEIRHISHLKQGGHEFGFEAAMFKTPYLDELARAYGGDGEVLQTKEDVENFQLTEKKLQGLYLVDVRVDPEFDPWKVWNPSRFS